MLSSGFFWIWVGLTFIAFLGFVLNTLYGAVARKIEGMDDYDENDVETDLLMEDETALPVSLDPEKPVIH